MGEAKVKTKIIKRKKRLFDDYDYESSYLNNLEMLSESFVDSMFSTTRYKVSYTTKTVTSGNQFEVEIYPAFKYGVGDIPSGIVKHEKKRETSKKQRDLNDRNSRKRLERLIHTNFGPGDYWITCTFKEEDVPNGLKDMQRLSSNFFKRINRLRKKKGLDNAKYVYVIEEGTYGTERFHLHLIMDGELTKEEIESKWKHGRVTNRTINYHGDENLLGLCKYIVKAPETYKRTQFRVKGKREWGSSKGNLKEPKERKNRTAFSKKKVQEMVKHRDGIGEILEAKYKNYNFKEVEVRYNDFNGLFYIYARMQDKRPIRCRN